MEARPKSLHALLVSIDNYPIPRHKLNGCVNDRNAFKDYIERRFGELNIQLNIKTLTDEEATKKAIIQSFQHFQAAEDGDICVFYFSGHGSQTQAHQAFWHLSPDRMNESVVCHDSRLPDGKDLIDKELRYLFWEATRDKELHFLAVFDCCHSGSLSRSLGGVTERIVSASPLPNKLEDYHGYEHYLREEEDGILKLTPPVGNLIQLGASKPYETAKELRINGQPRGIFTYSLIQSLEQGADMLSYNDILNTLRIRISSKVNNQSPQLIARPQDKVKRFLGASLPLASSHFMINFANGKWIVNAGAMQGVPAQGGKLQLMNGDEASISEVDTSQSIVTGMEGKDTTQSYKAILKETTFTKLKVAIAEGGDPSGIEILTNMFQELDPDYTELVADINDAEYWIRVIENSYQLTKPNDKRPVFRRIENYDENNAMTFIQDIATVSQWENLLLLGNANSTILDHEFQIELYRVTEPGNQSNSAPVELINWKEEPALRYEKDADGNWCEPAIKIKVTNTGVRKLYFSAVNLADNYGISNHFMDIQELNPNEYKWLEDEDHDGNLYTTTPLEVDESYSTWGVTEATEYFKFFISNDPELSTDLYNQDGLEYDVNLRDRAGRRRRRRPIVAQKDWTTREMKIKVVRPLETVALQENSAVTLLESIDVEAPAGIKADIQLASLGDTQRALGSSSSALRSLNGMALGETANLTPFEMTRGNKESPGLSILEMKNVVGSENVTADSPLKIRSTIQVEEGGTVIPIGYDEETGLLYPLGFMDEEGTIIVETLPDPSADNERSLTGSIKIAFQRMVLSRIPDGYKHPQLAIPIFESEDSEVFSYEKDVEKIKAAVASAENIALFIHGIIGDTTEMPKALKRAMLSDGSRLESKFDLSLTFDYENLSCPIEQSAKDLAEKLAEAGLAAGHGKNLTIIAHSMGGLVSRWFIEKEGGQEVVQHLIQLGTPNMGSPWSNVYDLASTLLTRVINGASFLQPYLIPLSFIGRLAKKFFKTLEQMHEKDSQFIKNVNDGTDPGIKYTIIAGNTQLIPVTYEEQQNTLIKKLFRRIKKRGHYDALDLALFKKPNDIAVSLESILGIAGKEARQINVTEFEVGCDHLSYFGNADSLEALVKAVENGTTTG